PTLSSVIIGVPAQEKGIRPAKALPYELDAHGSVHASSRTVSLTFLNTGSAAAVFQVRSGNPSDAVRFYTVEPGKKLSDAWSASESYNLSVYGPNGFVRFFNGSIGASAADLKVRSSYGTSGGGSIAWNITNLASKAAITVLDAYTGETYTQSLDGGDNFEGELSLRQFHGWYDLIVTVAGDPTFKYRLAGHVETGADSFS